jgi:hypothetical protein
MAAATGLATTSFIASGLFDDTGILADEARIIEEADRPRRGPVNVSIPTVVISAFIFIAILSWFEFMREWYDYTFIVKGTSRENSSSLGVVFAKFWFAIFITAVAIVGVCIVYRVFPENTTSR